MFLQEGPKLFSCTKSSSFQKQVQSMNKLCNNLLEKMIKEERDSDVASKYFGDACILMYSLFFPSSLNLNKSCRQNFY